MMDFDTGFSALVRVSGWLLAIYVVVSGRLDPTQSVALILAMIGFDVVSRARERKIPELIDKKRRGSGGDGE